MIDRLLALSAVLALCIAAPTCNAQTSGAGAQAQGYVPPTRGAPARRVGGSSRGIDDELPNVVVLVPDHVGLTTMEQPTLYWYLSKPTSIRIDITLISDASIQPVIEAAVGKTLPAGIHAIRLSDYGVTLAPDVEYEWSVALVLNPDERSHDIISAGAIMRVPATEEQKTRLAGVERGAMGMAYAQQGLWYDAIAMLSESIAGSAANDDWRGQRARILEQAGLNEPGAYDARFGKPAAGSSGNSFQ